jgi:hypothetical protein
MQEAGPDVGGGLAFSKGLKANRLTEKRITKSALVGHPGRNDDTRETVNDGPTDQLYL